MDLSASMQRLYAPLVACWWLGVVTGLYFWAGLSVTAPPAKRHLRLIADNGKLVEQQ